MKYLKDNIRFSLLRQNSEQWTENSIKVAGSIEPLNHMAKCLLKTPSTNKNHQAGKEGAGVMTTISSDFNTEKFMLTKLETEQT